jgi:hypothetical protein
LRVCAGEGIAAKTSAAQADVMRRTGEGDRPAPFVPISENLYSAAARHAAAHGEEAALTCKCL